MSNLGINVLNVEFSTCFSGLDKLQFMDTQSDPLTIAGKR